MKASIKAWMETLVFSCYRSSFDKLLHALIFETLVPASERLSISDVLPRLIFTKVKTYHLTVLDCLERNVTDQ